MEFVEHADDRPEPISIARCRELLGEEAESMTDQEVDVDPPTRGDDGVHRGRDVPGAVPHFRVETCRANAACPSRRMDLRCQPWSAR